MIVHKMADRLQYHLLKEFVKELRQKRPTRAESLLWDCLRGDALGTHFRRQHIIGTYIVDFCCVPKALVIELDGGYHQLPGQQTSDEERQQWLELQGFTVIRFRNEEVEYEIDKVIEIIKQYI